MSVLITPEADSQIQFIDSWWRSNRRAAPALFTDELANLFELLESAPQIGRLYRRSPIPQTRRALLRATRYHVYYVPVGEDVWVLAVWHAQRGVGPPLRIP